MGRGERDPRDATSAAEAPRRCERCGSAELREATETVSVELAGGHFKASAPVPARRCARCDGVELDGAAMERFRLHVGCQLADGGVHTGEALRYMRKALGLRACDLARLLDVTPETISHWETGKAKPSCAALVVTAAMIQDCMEGRTTTRDRLDALAAARGR